MPRCMSGSSVPGLAAARERSADVAIVGTSLGGLVAATLLAQRGRRVVLIEHADAVGGGAGAVATPDGYWIDFGHRDGHDVTDCEFPWHHGAAAARETGVAIAMRALVPPLRLHRLDDGAVIGGGDWSAAGFLRLAEDYFDCPHDGLEEMRGVMARLAGASPTEIADALPVSLGTWVAENVRHPGVRRALVQMATVIFHPRPTEASIGRLMQFFQNPKGTGGPYIADDDEVGAMQGLIEPWARAIRAAGGEILLGWKPVEIVVEEGRVRGVVAVDRTNLALEVHAPVVISTYPSWENFDLIDERLFPTDFVRDARALAAHRADLIGWQAALRRLPSVRASGHPDDHPGWNRILAGPERRYFAGWHLPSLTSRRAAPPGHHLLALVRAQFFAGSSKSGQPWSAARRDLDAAVAYLQRFYLDLDDCVVWSAYQYAAAPQSMSWLWAGVPRHGVAVEGIRGLLLASSTVEGPAGIVDLAAYAGRAAAEAALALA